ncbi:DUF4160 domain-containing protein [Azospirillum sp.]|uniref:DUF4160 domain-containing protein n=1 Tax=Azospirillum sp. TaxID=34012 RepID=UPI002D58EB7E|nr:DUF4160 domain-containing protein [Azospirillum sp.]HYF85152.1 DUF4160 domain-containing protein [Azospirillum sp.]
MDVTAVARALDAAGIGRSDFLHADHRPNWNARVYIYADDHNPPHFHIVGPDFNALVRINDLALLKGTAPPDTMRKVLEWAGENRPLLALRWIEINGEE